MNDELGFEHLTKRQLVRFCKKFHKDCYRLVGQKMKLKDQIKEARWIIENIIDGTGIAEENLRRAYQFLKESK